MSFVEMSVYLVEIHEPAVVIHVFLLIIFARKDLEQNLLHYNRMKDVSCFKSSLLLNIQKQYTQELQLVN
jgi:hypothetical protein